jgi:O-antigen/teichoic acid export membrane protein
VSLARQSQWLVLDRVALVGSLFATGVLVARGYGPSGYGAYLIASAVLHTVIGVIGSAADVPFVRAFVGAADAAARTSVLRAFGWGLAVASVLAGALIAGVAWLVLAGAFGATAGSPESRMLAGLLFAGLSALPQAPLWLGEWRLRAARQSHRIATVRVPMLLVGLALRIALVAWGLPLWMLVLLIGVETCAVAAAMWWRWDAQAGADALQERAVPSGAGTAAAARPLREALRQGAASLLVVVFFRVNPLIVGAVAGIPETARYGAALSLVLAFDVLTSSVTAAAFPRLVGRGAEPSACLPALLRIGRAYAAMAVCFVAGALLFGEQVLAIVYGADYRDAYPVLVVLSATTLFTSSAAVRGLYINLIGRSEFHILNAGLGLAALLPSSLLLASAHGALGAAVAMLAACAASGLLASFAFETTRPVGRVQLKSFLPFRADAR